MMLTFGLNQNKTETEQQERVKNIFSEIKVDDSYSNMDEVTSREENRSTESRTLKPWLNMTPAPARTTFKRGFQENFQVLQQWEGIVTEVDEEIFRARLSPILGDELGEKEAEIFIEEIGEDDRSLIQVGAIFYWSIGYLDRSSGRSRTSIIRFRRLPVWDDQELKNAKKANENWISELFQHE